MLCLALSTVAAGAELESRATGWAFLWDNDGFFTGDANEDRNYTAGMVGHVSGRRVAEWAISRPFRWIERQKPFSSFGIDDGAARSVSHSLDVGVSAFTPDNLGEPDPILNDRPYSSLLFVDVQRLALRADSRVAVTTELSLGMYGLFLAEGFQRWLHRQRQDTATGRPAIPEGWGNQISDGGEPTFRYMVRGQRLLYCNEAIDLQWGLEGHAGYYTNVATGPVVRLGAIASDWWTFSARPVEQHSVPLQTMMASVAAADSPALGGEQKRPKKCLTGRSGRFELYGWASATGRAWAYNGMMQGQFRPSEVRVPSSAVERFVKEYTLGLTFGTVWRNKWWHVTGARSYRSSEAKIGSRRSHQWGGIYIAVSPIAIH